MEVITIDSKAYNEIIEKLDKISQYISRNEFFSENKEDDIWLDSQEVANILHISTRTLQRLRKESLISYTVLRGRCLYKLSEIERSLNARIITCDPQTLDDFKRNYLLKNGLK